MRNLLDETKLNKKEQQLFFNSALHSDSRGGRIFLSTLLNGELLSEKVSVDPAALCTELREGNVYVSLNTFSKDERKSEYTYNIGAFYIDLDGHSLSDAELFLAKKHTLEVLEKAVGLELLCPWSMLTDTGRGFGVYFLLRASIPAYGKSAKVMRFYNAVYRMLIERIRMILDSCSDDTLEVDDAVTDKARLCRLPGTYNFKAHAECVLLQYHVDVMEEVLRYSLNEIVNLCGFSWEKKEKEEKTEHKEPQGVEKNLGKLYALLSERKRKLELLQSLREDWTGSREIFCFAYYNCVKQLYNTEDAFLHLSVFNRGFSGGGITEDELSNIVRSVQKNVSGDGKHCGYYKLTDDWICSSLGLSAEEKRICCFGRSVNTFKKHEKAVESRIARHKAVVSSIIQSETWDQVAKETGLSLRAVKKIGKQYGCTMRSKFSSAEDVNWKDVKTEMMYGKKEPVLCEKLEETLENRKEASTNLFADIHMEIDEFEEEEETETIIFDRNSYNFSYGFSFLSYLMDESEGKYHQMVEEFMDALDHIQNEKVFRRVLSAVQYLASEYTFMPSISAAIYDLAHITKALRNGHVSVVCHGLTCKPGIYMQRTEYPEQFEPVLSMPDRLQMYEDVFYTADPALVPVLDELTQFYGKIGGYVSCDTRYFSVKTSRTTMLKIKRKAFLQRVNNLNIFELAKVVQKLYKNRLKRRKENSFQSIFRTLLRATEKYKDLTEEQIAKKFVSCLFPEVQLS